MKELENIIKNSKFILEVVDDEITYLMGLEINFNQIINNNFVNSQILLFPIKKVNSVLLKISNVQSDLNTENYMNIFEYFEPMYKNKYHQLLNYISYESDKVVAFITGALETTDYKIIQTIYQK